MPHDDTQQNFYYINRRVGSTNYKVKVYFNSAENETIEEKILRMVKNDAIIWPAVASACLRTARICPSPMTGMVTL